MDLSLNAYENLNDQSLAVIAGGKGKNCIPGFLFGLAKGAASGAWGGSAIPGIGTIGGAVIGATRGMVGGAIKCLG